MTARATATLVAALAVAACSSKRSTTPGSDHAPPAPAGDAAAAATPPPPAVIDAAPTKIVLPAPPPLPARPGACRRRPSTRPRPRSPSASCCSSIRACRRTGKLACASCHDPDHGYGSPRVRDRTDAGGLDLRHTPALANLYVRKAFAWDGRYDDLASMIGAHARGQLGRGLGDDAPWLLANPTYAAHLERLGVPVDDQDGDPAVAPTVAASLAAFVRTRYAGDAPWDRYEAGDRGAVGPAAVRGYALFSGKAQCSVCHLRRCTPTCATTPSG